MEDLHLLVSPLDGVSTGIPCRITATPVSWAIVTRCAVCSSAVVYAKASRDMAAAKILSQEASQVMAVKHTTEKTVLLGNPRRTP